jgi:HK97 family phage major capsid protein/HK97 family phage prohead protease
MPEQGKGGYAYATLNIKNIDNEQRIIEGVASTPTPDRVGDIVEPLGAKFSLPMPLLWQHNSREPIGHVTWAEAREDGIPFRARIAKATEPGKLLDRLDEAWQSIKLGLVAAVSIGFKGIDVEDIDPKKPWGPQRFKAWEWLELSCVTLPANSEATIVNIRSIDQALRAAPGNEQASIDLPPATGTKSKPAGTSARSIIVERAKTMPMTNAERTKGLEEKRAAEMAALESIQSKIAEENRTKDESEQEAFDGHAATIKSIDRELSDCRLIERELVAKAKPPVVVDQNGTTVEMNQPVIQVTAPKLEPGHGLIKMLACELHARQFHRDIFAVSRQFCAQWPQVENNLRQKAAVAYGTTTGTTWAAPLVYAQNLASEFVEFLTPQTVLGRIVGLTRVPFNVRVPRENAVITAQWVGEGESKPVAAGSFDTVSLLFNKIACIMGVTQELARFSNPSVELLVRNNLAKGVAKFIDEQFLNPAITAITGSRPASITNGADSDAASGTASTDLIHDIREILKHFQDNNIPTDSLVLIMQPQLGTAIGSIYTTLGVRQFPDVSGTGGTVSGLQILTSGNSPAGQITALHAPSVALADDGGLDIAASTEASVELDDNPTSGNYHLVSAFQNNLLFVRAERFITWKRLRDKGVFYLTNAAYGGAVT